MGASGRPSRSAVAIRHVPFEDLGIYEPLLRLRGYTVSYRDAAVDDLNLEAVERASLLVVLGGPIGAGEEDRYPFIKDELQLLEARCRLGLPTLGICLGAQLLARCLGAEVFPLGVKEIGFAPLELTEEGKVSPLRHLEGRAVLHWHGDTYSLPAGARRLASTRVCREQAFAWSGHVLALQFHPEWDPVRLEQWLIGHACELSAAKIDPRTLRAQARDLAVATIEARQQCFAEWLAAVEQGGA